METLAKSANLCQVYFICVRCVLLVCGFLTAFGMTSLCPCHAERSEASTTGFLTAFGMTSLVMLSEA